jgi:peroxiredoxin
MRRFFSHPVGLALALVMAVSTSPARAQTREAPVFRIPAIDGTTLDLREQRGTVVLLNFWATWCVPCLTELEAFRTLHARYAARGFTVLAVSVDQPQTAARVRSFAQARAFPFPVLLDPDEAVYRLYGGAVMPTSVLIDAEGRIAHRKEGYQPGDEADWEHRIDALLASPEVVPDTVAPMTGHPPSSPSSNTATRVDKPFVVSGVTLSGSNFLRANYGKESRDLPASNGWLEDWFDFRIAGDRLGYQARFRTYQFLRDLPDSRENLVRDPNHRVVKQTVTYKDDHADIRAGNFYGTLNRGLVLRLFEDRQARIDKDAKGIWASLQSGSAAAAGRSGQGIGRVRGSVFGGNTYARFDDLYAMDADEDNLRNTWLQGVEGEWEPAFLPGGGLTVGAQALEAFRDNWHVQLAGGNAAWERGPTTLYLGYVGLRGQDAFNYPNDFTGRALYAAAAQNLGRLELGAEYKYYHNYDLGFAEPPSLVPYHTFRLTARDMPFPNNQREEGGVLRGAWQFRDGARYALNVSRIVSHPERNPAFLIHHIEMPYLDLDQSLHLQGSEGGTLLLGLNWNDQRRFESGSFEDTRAVTIGAIGTKPLAGNWNIGWEAEAQRREVELRPVLPPDPLGGVGPLAASATPWMAVLSGTAGRGGLWTFTLDYEVTAAVRERDPGSVHDRIPGVSNGWVSAQLTLLMLERHTIALWGGQRKERVICSGGSCRIEPAFEGGELTWLAHF